MFATCRRQHFYHESTILVRMIGVNWTKLIFSRFWVYTNVKMWLKEINIEYGIKKNDNRYIKSIYKYTSICDLKVTVQNIWQLTWKAPRIWQTCNKLDLWNWYLFYDILKKQMLREKCLLRKEVMGIRYGMSSIILPYINYPIWPRYESKLW